MKKLFSYFRLIRIQNCLMASLGVAVGQYLLPVEEPLPLNRYAMAAAFFVCGFGNILNDLLDIEPDRINHPHRPLAAGKISKAAAVYTLVIFLLISLAMVMPLANTARIAVILAIGVLVLYNYKLKHFSYFGNFAVSFLGGMTLILGGLAVNWQATFRIPGPLVAAGFAILIHFGREVVKDIADSRGDAAFGSRTAPARGRMEASRTIALLDYAALTILSLAVYFAGWFDIIYLITVIFLVILPLGLVSAKLWRAGDGANYGAAAGLIKLVMIPGLIALFIGRSY